MSYIYQYAQWPHFIWNDSSLIGLLAEARFHQGALYGKMKSLGFSLQDEASLESLSLDIIKSSQIEGEILNQEQVRSSVARRLGIEMAGSIQTDRHIEGITDMLFDAVTHYNQPLTKDRLFDWHSALFPTGRSGMHKITVGNWREAAKEPMQIVSGPVGREWIHYTAPSAETIEKEMSTFCSWFNEDSLSEPIVKAGIAHLWFVTIHPFEDGNGRIARALTDLLLARAEASSQRFYSMSSRIMAERKVYYDILEKTQHGDLDITEWLIWFVNCFMNAIRDSESILSKIFAKNSFWERFSHCTFNKRQITMLNKLLDKFQGKLTTVKWAKMMKCSPDTALRDIQELIKNGVLEKDKAGGRSTSYSLT